MFSPIMCEIWWPNTIAGSEITNQALLLADKSDATDASEFHKVGKVVMYQGSTQQSTWLLYQLKLASLGDERVI